MRSRPLDGICVSAGDSRFAPGVPEPRLRIEAWLVAFAALAAPATSGAGEPPVRVGEVRASVGSTDFSEPLRAMLRDGIARTAFGRAREAFVLSATLERLDAERVGHGARATAAVSLVVRRAREQTLCALVNGHATAEETDASVGETRDDALRAAVESALRRLPEAVR
jgi:hypothetical protein